MQIIIGDDVVVMLSHLELMHGPSEPLFDMLFLLGFPIEETGPQLGQRWGSDEDIDGPVTQFFELDRPLSVDHEDHMLALMKFLFNMLFKCPVMVSKDGRMLEKLSPFFPLFKVRYGHEMVIFIGDFTWPDWASGAGDTLADAWEFIDQHPGKRRFAGPSRCAHHDDKSFSKRS